MQSKKKKDPDDHDRFFTSDSMDRWMDIDGFKLIEERRRAVMLSDDARERDCVSARWDLID